MVSSRTVLKLLTTALISKAKIDVQVSGCDIVGVYLKEKY